MRPLPRILQGGMGAGVSDWRLARAVSRTGELGIVAGTALDVILARRLQLGDPGGHVRRALAAFPFPDVARRLVERWFVAGGKPADAPFRAKPMPSEAPSRELVELTVAANFVEVFLAREGHDHAVGINYLEKIQAPTLPSLYGAILAGVGYVCMGAGIPLAIPGALDALARGERAELRLDVDGGEPFTLGFDPRELGPVPAGLARPRFLAIVSGEALASVLLRKASGRVDGFVVEHHTAGGHNAPPRGRAELDARGEPVYGPRDEARLEAFRGFDRPFWLAGSQAEPERLAAALAEGAAGIQVGTAFAFCAESGLDAGWKREVLRRSRAGTLRVRTDPVASPTGFPFKVLELEGTLADERADAAPGRKCDLGYLRQAYRRADGTLGWRCPAEDPEHFVTKGGERAATPGRKCLCNGLLANVGLAQVRDGVRERPILTAGDDVVGVHRFLAAGRETYGAADVIAYCAGAR
ncbi:MAG: nitronate monooxygenase [Planctomycetes bacterium]|nr:nitronate monooxygenase [Planctomycetota bacterium]